MKTKHLLITATILVAIGAGWAGRVAWRVHRQRVSLDVRNMPLGEVLRKIEWQTWQSIRAEQALDARITLHVTDVPLKDVLDRIAEQAGAHWSTVYAVYRSGSGRKALETALAGDGKLEAAGWTKLAPKASELAEGRAGGAGPKMFPDRNADPSGPVSEPDPQMGGGPGPTMGGVMMFRRGPNDGGVMFTKNPNGQTELWSPTELVMQTALCPRLGSDQSPAPTAQAAAEAARKVNAKWTTYLAFRKSIMGVGFVGPGRPGDALRRGPNERFANLTPEQRVERARQRKSFQAGGHFLGP